MCEKQKNQKLLLKICSGATWNNLSVCSTTRRVRRKKVYEEAAHWKAHRQDSAREGASLRVCPTLSFVSAAPKLKYAYWHQATIYRQKRSCRSQDGEPQYEEKRRHANIVFFLVPKARPSVRTDCFKRRSNEKEVQFCLFWMLASTSIRCTWHRLAIQVEGGVRWLNIERPMNILTMADNERKHVGVGDVDTDRHNDVIIHV